MKIQTTVKNLTALMDEYLHGLKFTVGDIKGLTNGSDLEHKLNDADFVHLADVLNDAMDRVDYPNDLEILRKYKPDETRNIR